MADKKKKKISKKPTEIKKYCSVVYMLPEEVNAEKLAENLSFLEKETVEVWRDANVLELTLANGMLTIEDMMPELDNAEDKALLMELKAKQVYVCDYEEADKREVKRILQSLTEQFGGFLASCTENFEPFLKVEEL